MDFYVYLDEKKTTGEVFYVGKGCRDRAWTKTRRNEDWHVVVEECGYFVEIVQDNLQEYLHLSSLFRSTQLVLFLTQKHTTLVNYQELFQQYNHTS